MTTTAGYPTNPPLECDVVLKGGITSGVIYPGLLCELARVYRLRSVGGTSAGAIAAAAAAAAELDRAGGGFDRLADLPRDLTRVPPGRRDSVLFTLFAPQRGARGLFGVLAAGLGRRGISKKLHVLVALVRGFALWTAVGMAPGVAVLVLGALGTGLARWTAVAAGAVLLLLGAAGQVAGLPRRGFGLCSGMSASGDTLTPWLHATLQSLAGRRPEDPPVTFGDLVDAGIDLRMMTTNLTTHEPLVMPWETRAYSFHRGQFRALFPERVVAWLEAHPPPGSSAATPGDWRPLPDARDLPIIVATRMSLSFPLLLTAVPLYAVDYTQPTSQASDAPRAEPEVNWFSDGGICSNLPVQFFDAPLPTRPTFAVDLEGFPPGRERDPDECNNVSLPSSNAPRDTQWTRWNASGLGALAAFLRSIVDTAREWVDESHLQMPGYRDRIVTIFHDAVEGGMNLDMDKAVVDRLVARGGCAGQELVQRFAGAQPGVQPAPGWTNHRWVRFRTATAALSDWLAGFQHGYSTTSPGAVPYAELAGPDASSPLPSYRLSPRQREVVNARTGELLATAADWTSPPRTAFTNGRPRRAPRLGLLPDDGAATIAPHGARTRRSPGAS